MSEQNPDTRPQPPQQPPELPESEATRVQADVSRTKAMQPVEPPAAPAVPPAPPKKQAERVPPPPPPLAQPRPPLQSRRGLPAPSRRDNALYIPLWSVGLTLVVVCGAVTCIVAAVVGLGGNLPPVSPPRFVIITANVPSSTPFVPAVLGSQQTPAVIPLGEPGAASSFSLAGPTLQPVEISPTPTPAPRITVGSTVRVVNERGVNIRSDAGVANRAVELAEFGEEFSVLEGPRQADGLTWWRIQNATMNGWAAETDGTDTLLQVVSP